MWCFALCGRIGVATVVVNAQPPSSKATAPEILLPPCFHLGQGLWWGAFPVGRDTTRLKLLPGSGSRGQGVDLSAHEEGGAFSIRVGTVVGVNSALRRDRGLARSQGCVVAGSGGAVVGKWSRGNPGRPGSGTVPRGAPGSTGEWPGSTGKWPGTPIKLQFCRRQGFWPVSCPFSQACSVKKHSTALNML